MELDKIKRLTLRALMSDETLMYSLVLKGGNALQLAYDITNRGSIDIDFSVEGDFSSEDIKRLPKWLEYILNQTFRPEGLIAFDVKFEPKPKAGSIPEWKGYMLEFKLIELDFYNKNTDKEVIRRNAIKLNGQSSRYVVDISAYEYVEAATTREIEGFILRVYTLEMILIEKLRALCQSMPAYKEIVRSANSKQRARDIYDIYIIYNSRELNLDPQLFDEIFKAKQVPRQFLNDLETLREHNRPNWETVVQTVSAEEVLEEYDFYFDKVLDIAAPFKVL